MYERMRPVAIPGLLLLLLTGAMPATAGAAELLYSTAADRSGALPLEGGTVRGEVYAFVAPGTGISRVVFHLDDPGLSTPVQTENLAPYDFAGSVNKVLTAHPFDTTALTDGTHTIGARVYYANGGDELLQGTFTVANDGAGSGYAILNGTAPNRAAPAALEGATLDGDAFIHIAPETGLNRVEWFIDNPDLIGAPSQVERIAPWDLAGTAADDTARPFDTAQLGDGSHTVTVRLVLGDGSSQHLLAAFTVNNDGALPSLTAAPAAVQLSAPAGSGIPLSATLQVATGDGATPAYAVQSDAAWLSAAARAGTLPDTVDLAADPAGLAAGRYAGNVTVSAGGYPDVVIPVALEVVDDSGCSPLPCNELRVVLPYQLDFDVDHGGVPDGAGIGTGFTYVQPTSAGNGYLPARLRADSANGELVITTTAGIFHGGANRQDNALGIGIYAPSQPTEIAATLVAPPAGSGNYQQAGLWFGTDEDNYVKLVVVSTPSGTRIQHYHEFDGQWAYEASTAAGDVGAARVTLVLTLTPATRSIASAYRIDGGPLQDLGGDTAPAELFSLDAAGIDPAIGTRSFGGVFATHRYGSTPLQYRFDAFSARALPLDPGGLPELDFTRSSHALPSPTAMAWGPDDRLYVTSLMGEIHALSYGPDGQVIDDQAIAGLVDDLGARLTLGIAVDPASTADAVTLWVSHSSPSLNQGVPNSSMVSRLSGADFATVEHVITGLPRAKANHAINAIHFGPDGRLYLAQGGNTGAGAPNETNSLFGTIAEQPLSAALLVADVHAPGFDGSCDNLDDLYGPPPCDVAVYAGGVRNMYDFVFHSNGELYGPDNGPGANDTFPPSPTPPCPGFGDAAAWTDGGNNPGPYPDILNRLEPGMYYGHPNPARDECVYKDGSYQTAIPLPNWRAPLLALGEHTSSNGIVEYPADVACGALKGDLLITNYAVGDDVVRVRLSADGQSVVESGVLVAGFGDPLPIATTVTGDIIVGELSANAVTRLHPISLGCWQSHRELPTPLLDSGGTALDGRVYVVGGNTAAGPVASLHVYDPAGDGWSRGPDLPTAAVENPAVAAVDGKLYAFGGSTAPLAGAVGDAAAFDPASGTWATLAPMPSARSGAVAAALNGLIYVVGGMDADGGSVATVDVYDPAGDSWSSGASLPTRRDNPGAAVLDGRLYVFGGRIRNADGTEVAGALTVVEAFDPASGAWSARAPMPTGRRNLMVGMLNGRAQVMGGEPVSDGSTFPQNEEYDPSTNTWRALTPMQLPRHGAVAASIGDRIYVAGGGPEAGPSYSAATDSFGF